MQELLPGQVDPADILQAQLIVKEQELARERTENARLRTENAKAKVALARADKLTQLNVSLALFYVALIIYTLWKLNH
ncbi:MAG: hypothetical protein ACYC44_02525 [Patescibacteria group bacterium]